MEQEKPTTPVFSIADEIQRRQKEADERRATWEQKRQRATDLYRDGQNPILAFIDTMKPQQDTDRIKRAEKAAARSQGSGYRSGAGRSAGAGTGRSSRSAPNESNRAAPSGADPWAKWRK